MSFLILVREKPFFFGKSEKIIYFTIQIVREKPHESSGKTEIIFLNAVETSVTKETCTVYFLPSKNYPNDETKIP